MGKIAFKLDPSPTFKATVLIPVPGTTGEPVDFIFKHRAREDFMEFMDRAGKLGNVAVVMECASGWELSEPFDQAHIEKMDTGYLGAAKAVFDKYVEEMTGSGHRLGN